MLFRSGGGLCAVPGGHGRTSCRALAGAARWCGRGPGATRRAALGGLLFLCSDALLAFNRFHTPLPASALWVLATYWAAQWLIASALARR